MAKVLSSSMKLADENRVKSSPLIIGGSLKLMCWSFQVVKNGSFGDGRGPLPGVDSSVPYDSGVGIAGVMGLAN